MILHKQQYGNLKFVILLFILSIEHEIKAQLSFPQGNILNLNTNNDFLYLETRILFNTGVYKADDYKWVKISDSLDIRWFITACFNGECRNELASNGDFIKDYGLNDSTGFIAFHVETYGYDGVSVIKYRVYNKNNISDQADMTFNIFYKNTTEIKFNSDKNESKIKFVNPAKDVITIINYDGNINEVSMYDLQGKKICEWNPLDLNKEGTILEIPYGLAGIYTVSLNINGTIILKKLIIY